MPEIFSDFNNIFFKFKRRISNECSPNCRAVGSAPEALERLLRWQSG